jgi:hypothetical protein
MPHIINYFFIRPNLPKVAKPHRSKTGCPLRCRLDAIDNIKLIKTHKPLAKERHSGISSSMRLVHLLEQLREQLGR